MSVCPGRGLSARARSPPRALEKSVSNRIESGHEVSLGEGSSPSLGTIFGVGSRRGHGSLVRAEGRAHGQRRPNLAALLRPARTHAGISGTSDNRIYLAWGAACVAHAPMFFNRPAFDLASAVPPTFTLMPEGGIYDALKQDYAAMSGSLMRAAPPCRPTVFGRQTCQTPRATAVGIIMILSAGCGPNCLARM